MTNKEAIDDLKNFRAGLGAGCRLLVEEHGLDIQRAHIHAITSAIKALEVVEKIKETYRDNSGWWKEYFALEVHDILCGAYGAEEDCESWIREYKHDL